MGAWTLNYRLLCIGRRARDPLLEAAEGYAARLARYATIDIVRLRESNAADEAKRLLERLPAGHTVVALDERGRQLDTNAWATQVRTWQTAAQTRVDFVIGGADGLHDALKARAQALWSLSMLTLPHRLAQVVLLEGLYRVHTVLRGEKYHRA